MSAVWVMEMGLIYCYLKSLGPRARAEAKTSQVKLVLGNSQWLLHIDYSSQANPVYCFKCACMLLYIRILICILLLLLNECRTMKCKQVLFHSHVFHKGFVLVQCGQFTQSSKLKVLRYITSISLAAHVTRMFTQLCCWFGLFFLLLLVCLMTSRTI